ncbi:TRAP transporter large permease subunit [Thermodesulfobacteriota bacterium]
MEWQYILLIGFGSLVVIMATGLPVAFSFLLINMMGVILLWGGETGLQQLIINVFNGMTTFTILPVPLFILMGEIMFHSGIASDMLDAVDKWLGRLPGRLSLVAVGSGTLIATLTGASMASVAMLGSVLVPQMQERGYKNAMTLGPILGCGAIAVMIPPSALAVLLGSIGEISIGKILIAIIIPGLLMSFLYIVYIIIRCYLQSSLAPSYEVVQVSMYEKLISTARYILPIGFIIFLVIGFILLGIATPTEAAASGALGCIILAAFNRRLNFLLLKKALYGTLQLTVMIYMLIVGASVFSQILAFSGATNGLVELAMGFAVSPILILIGMQVVVLILGCFIAVLPVMMITLPIFMPIVEALNFNQVWFAVVFLIAAEIGGITPPFGFSLFVMKGVAPKNITMAEIYRSALPFFGIQLIVLALVIAFPALALWLLGAMR